MRKEIERVVELAADHINVHYGMTEELDQAIADLESVMLPEDHAAVSKEVLRLVCTVLRPLADHSIPDRKTLSESNAQFLLDVLTETLHSMTHITLTSPQSPASDRAEVCPETVMCSGCQGTGMIYVGGEEYPHSICQGTGRVSATRG